jgi:hypothetical protein
VDNLKGPGRIFPALSFYKGMGHYYDIVVTTESGKCFKKAIKDWSEQPAFRWLVEEGHFCAKGKTTILVEGDSDMPAYRITVERIRG